MSEDSKRVDSPVNFEGKWKVEISYHKFGNFVPTISDEQDTPVVGAHVYPGVLEAIVADHNRPREATFYTAYIDAPKGGADFSGWKPEEVHRQVADWCRQNWDRLVGCESPADMDDETLVQHFFQELVFPHGYECYLHEAEFEIVFPTE